MAAGAAYGQDTVRLRDTVVLLRTDTLVVRRTDTVTVRVVEAP